jgi:hypothetical protein
MATVTLFDAAYPNPQVDPHVAGALVYIGGDTPHVWSEPEIRAAYGRYRLPTYVRSNPQNADPIGDAGQALAWLAAHHVPAGRAVVLDLETAVNAVYVLAFGQKLHAAGYKVWPYGSKSTLFKNPALDGYFVADYTQVEHQDAGCIATQWSDAAGAYDLDDTDAVALLWDYAAPAPTTHNGVENMILRDPQTGGVWVVASANGAIYAYDGAPFLGGTNNSAVNPGNYPVVGIAEFTNASGVGYEIVLDWGDAGGGKASDGGDRFRRYRFPRDGSMAKV